MKTEENNKTRLTALVATGVLGLFFLGSSAFLYVDNNDLKEENRIATEQVETLSSVKEQLQAELKEIDAELSKYKGKNEELDNLLKGAQRDLQERKKKINKLLKQNASLEKFKKEAKALRKLKETHLTKMKDMEQKLAMLSEENNDLKEDKERLQVELQTLSNNYMVLERKVEIASILKVDNVLAATEKKAKNGKYSKTNSPKKADRLTIDFELSENRVADKGEKTIYIRIIDPSGKVLQGGTFTNEDGNIEIPYSVQKVVNYDNDKIKSNAVYEVGNQDLKAGEYTLEFYCEGHFCGASKYKLK